LDYLFEQKKYNVFQAQPTSRFSRSKSNTTFNERKNQFELRCQNTKYCQPQLINVSDWLETTTRVEEQQTVKEKNNFNSKIKNIRPNTTSDLNKDKKLIVNVCKGKGVYELLESWKRTFKISDTQNFVEKKNNLLTSSEVNNSKLFMDFIKPVTVNNAAKTLNPKARPITHSGFRQNLKTLCNKS